MTPTDRNINYVPAGPTIEAFHKSEAFFRGLKGPIGSSKSVACTIEILRRAQMQSPGPDGIRRTRWAIIRTSYPELRSTTLKTWTEWVPSDLGKLTHDSPITHRIRSEGHDIEVLFLALDKEEDQRKLLSLELTGAWLNEAREISYDIVKAVTGRVGRYPSKNLGGCDWSGIVADTNAPDSDSWWYKLAEVDRPEGYVFFNQPPGDSPQAENIHNLPKNYYERIKAGKDDDWIKVYVRGQYAFLTEGKAVYPMYRDSTHTAPEPIEPVKDIGLIIGADWGLTPAAVIGQKLPDGRIFILDEFIADNCGYVRFAELLVNYMRDYYGDYDVDFCFGDPAGEARSASDERTAFEIMNDSTPWKWKPAPTNDITMRREAVVNALNRMVEGRPGLFVSPKAATLRKGFVGSYHYKFIKSGNGAQTFDTPAKNSYSHIHDACQYMICGATGVDVLAKQIRKRERPRSRKVLGTDYDPFDY